MIRLVPVCLLLMLAAPLLASPAMAEKVKTDTLDAGNLYVRFKPIIVTLIQQDRPSGLVSVTVTVKTPSQKKREATETLRNRYIDAFTRTLMILGQSHIDPKRPLDVALINAELQKAADLAVGAGHGRVLVVDANTKAY